jgi:hypothetical protein
VAVGRPIAPVLVPVPVPTVITKEYVPFAAIESPEVLKCVEIVGAVPEETRTLFPEPLFITFPFTDRDITLACGTGLFPTLNVVIAPKLLFICGRFDGLSFKTST